MNGRGLRSGEGRILCAIARETGNIVDWLRCGASFPPSLLPSLPPSFLPSVVGNGADVTGRRPFLAAAGESLVSDFFELRRAIRPPSFRATPLQSCVETFLLSSKNQPQNVPLLTLKMHYGVIFHPAIPETWQRCFYTTLYILHSLAKWFISSCGFG